MFVHMVDGVEIIGWDGAIPRIAALLAGPRPVVGITGPAGAGKSTLASSLAEQTGGIVISTDDYLPDYEGLAIDVRDLPEHADLGLLSEHLHRLRAGGSVDMPTWSFHEHRRTGSRRVGPATGPIVCEGLFALHDLLRRAVDVRVYVEADRVTRWGRWEAIERRGERGMGVEPARRFFYDVAEPTFERFAPEYRASADVVVLNDGG